MNRGWNDEKILLGCRELISLDNSDIVETCCLLSRLSNQKPDSNIKLSLDMKEDYDIVDKEVAN